MSKISPTPLEPDFPAIRFRGELRPSQADVVDLARRKLADGRRRLHIVAPPGSGKTVLGLYLWAECIQKAAVVLSPNSAIQSQWAARIDLFESPAETSPLVSTDSARPAWLTSLTYQSVTLPGRGDADVESQAIALWQDRLIEAEQAKDPDEALVWIADLRQHNTDYYEHRLSGYRKQIRDAAAVAGRSLEMLHESSLATLRRLKDRGVELIILDECHHLMGHWGRVLADAHDLLDQPVVIGLTATPPDRDGKRPEDIERYDEFFGEIDYEVPVPAVVKDGFLAPYQDLAYFVRPTQEELHFVANADDQLHGIVAELCRPPAALESGSNAADRVSATRESTPDSAADAPPDAAATAPPEPRRVLRRVSDLDPPEWVAASSQASSPAAPEAPSRTVQASHRTKKAPAENPPAEKNSANRAGQGHPPGPERTGAPLTGWLTDVLTELGLPTGPVKDWAAFEKRDPVFAQAASVFLLRREFELPPHVTPPTWETPPDEIPEMEFLTPILDRYVRHHLRRSPRTEDHRLAERITRQLRTLGVQITETGSQPCASPVGRVLAYSTSKMGALLPILEAETQQLGDRIRAVVVADYEKTSAVTAEVEHLLDAEAGGAIAAFKQLIRHPGTDSLDPILVTGSSVLVDDDLVERFGAAAQAWLEQRGCDVQLDSVDESGFHVIRGRGRDWCPRVYVAMITDLFQEGLTRCLVGTRGLLGEGWDANKINVLVDLTTVTTSMTVNQLRGRSIRLDPQQPDKLANNWDVVCIAPEFSKGLDDYRRFKAKHQTLFGITDDGVIEKGVGHVHAAFTELGPEGLEQSVSLLNSDMLQRAGRRLLARKLWRIGQPYRADPIRTLEAKTSSRGGFPPLKKSRHPWNERSLTLAIGRAVLEALWEADLVPRAGRIHLGDRAGGYVRVFLEEAAQEDCAIFIDALHEVLGPFHRPRYVIPRYVDRVTETWLSSILPSIVGRYFQQRKRQRVMLHAVPASLARNRSLVEIFQRHWNRHVSPGQALYAHRGAGQQLVDQARRSGHVPRGKVHQKEIFL